MTQVSAARRNVTLGMVCLVAFLSYVDRQIFTLFQEDIKAALGLTDGQLGLLTGMSFALFYVLAGFPIARYADKGDRRLVIGVCVIVWSTATALCGIAQSYVQLLLARIGLAAGEAGAGPAGNSLITEIFPLNRRTTVISIILAANAVGLSGGLALGGWLSLYFDWRAVFLILGLPGILVGVLVWLLCVEPRRAAGAKVVPPPQIPMRDVLRIIAGSTSLRWAGLLLTASAMAGFSFILWGASFFQRVHGMSKAETGFWLGGAMATGLVLGNLLAGWVNDRFGKANPRFNGWFSGISNFCAFPCGLGFALASDPYVSLACFVLMKFLMSLYLGPIMALCFAQVPIAMRAMISAVIAMLIGFAGTGLGGTLAGFASQAFEPGYGALSLQPALALMSCFLLVSGISAIFAGHTAKPLPENT